MLILALASAISPHSSQASSHDNKKQLPTVRWDETHPGCTYSRGDDGRFRYGLWTGDLAITLAVDSQELEKVRHRHEPFFAAFLDVRYRGQGTLQLNVEKISLEFVKHFQVIQPSLNPEDFAEKVQSDADTLNDQAAREVKQHPERRDAEQAYVRAFLEDSAELQEFVGKNSLRPTLLSPGNSEAGGWVLFSAESKWIGRWKKREEFILRLPLEDRILQFPFQLPPPPGDVQLRKRE